MKVSEAMTRDVRVANPDETVQKAAKIMANLDTGVLPVGENDQLIGMITDRDIAIRGIAQGKGPKAKVRDIMTEDVKYCFEDQELEDVTRNMADIQVRRLPVLNRDKRLVGILSLGDIATSHDGKIIPLPAPQLDPPVITLAEVIGSAAASTIQSSGKLVFHSVGDTGNSDRHSEQSQVVEAMILDFHRTNASNHPAFFLHLGDVCYDIVYSPSVKKADLYPSQFDAAYKQYPGKILAAAGNQDIA